MTELMRPIERNLVECAVLELTRMIAGSTQRVISNDKFFQDKGRGECVMSFSQRFFQILTTISIVAGSSQLSYGESHDYNESRAAVLANFDQPRQFILDAMRRNPKKADLALSEFIARPVGAHPRVFSLFDEVIAASTTTAGITAVIHALLDIAPTDGAKPFTARILQFADKGVRDGDLDTKLWAAEVIFFLGPQYRNHLEQSYLAIFNSDPPPEISEDVQSHMGWIIERHLLKWSRNDRTARRIIKMASEKYNLLAFFRSRIEDPNQPGTIETRFMEFREWQQLMWSAR